MNPLKCSFKSNGSLIGAGSADRMVYAWDFDTGEIMYKLPGHKGSVTSVVFHPNVNIIASCSIDKQIYLGEI